LHFGRLRRRGELSLIGLRYNAAQPVFARRRSYYRQIGDHVYVERAESCECGCGRIGVTFVRVTNTGSGALSNGNVELQIFDKLGQAVATMVWSGQDFTSGQSRQYSYTWIPAAALPPGDYVVDVGVFDGGWAENSYWNTDATITVTAAQAAMPRRMGVGRKRMFGEQEQ